MRKLAAKQENAEMDYNRNDRVEIRNNINVTTSMFW